jgi:hypothetical protein
VSVTRLKALPTRALARGVLSYATATRTLARLIDHSIAGLEGLLSHGLMSEEREALTVAINQQVTNGGGTARRALFEWEMRWFAEALPKAPASVLLGGAGDGAEALPLRAAGYEVHAFEPAASCLAPLKAAVGPCGSASVLSYQDLLAASLGKDAQRIAVRRYDAVVLGWNSLSHVLDAETRSQLMRVLARLCPQGPILLSFNLISESEPERKSRAFELGARAGATLARVRGLPEPEQAERERFWPHSGFVHLFTRAEIDALAKAAGRLASVREGPFPHAVMRLAK